MSVGRRLRQPAGVSSRQPPLNCGTRSGRHAVAPGEGQLRSSLGAGPGSSGLLVLPGGVPHGRGALGARPEQPGGRERWP